MSIIQVNHISFTYPGSYEPVFTDLTFAMDTDWRLGLVGRNGRGKTTLLKLLAGQLQGRGEIVASVSFDLFPFPVDEQHSALTVLRQAIAPFDEWERDMERLLKEKTPQAIEAWGQIEHAYSVADGYIINELIAREVSRMAVDATQLERPFATFSPGERTRMLLCALFLRKNNFLLIDEPTNHLDMQGREIVAEYLSRKSGFLLVSHDRAFLDKSVDHIVALHKAEVRVEQGTYSTYRHNKQLQDDFEREKNARLLKDIDRLKQSSREKAVWSDRVEATKIGFGPCDRGAIGAKAARMMKRSLAIRTRIDRQIEEKESLLKNLEYTAPISLHPLQHPLDTLVRLTDVAAGYAPESPILTGLTLRVKQGERLALTGPNGCGKSTMLKLLTGELAPLSGQVYRAGGLVVSYLPQSAEHVTGTPYDIAQAQDLDITYFLTLLRKLDFPREAFDRDAQGFSMGQRKKLVLAASMARSAHLYVWDEPLNYIDVESREQIEDMLQETSATLVFVEHDRRFVDRIATRIIQL
ncbi:MAG: ribosomal protection-like ABC-F family protein [Christensenellales bacterium]|jgi:lincosamide and streptogramin A transport system ATP-binding/permease protein